VDKVLCVRTRTATRSCRTRKRAFRFYSLGVVYAATMQRGKCGHAAQCPTLPRFYASVASAAATAAAAAAAAVATVYSQFVD